MSTAAGVRSTYDALGRITQSTQDSELGTLTTATAYLSGARRQVTDPKGHVFTTSYQVFDQPAYDAPILVQTPGSIAQAITRDIYSKPLSITQSGLYGGTQVSLTKTWLYDIHQRLCHTWKPPSVTIVVCSIEPALEGKKALGSLILTAVRNKSVRTESVKAQDWMAVARKRDSKVPAYCPKTHPRPSSAKDRPDRPDASA